MSEEEILNINILKRLCGIFDRQQEKTDGDYCEFVGIEEIDAIKNLLDLYNKEKEELQERNIRLQEEINEVCRLKTELYGNSISKNEIRELLDRFDLEEGLQNYYDDLTGSEAVIKILKILLKGI